LLLLSLLLLSLLTNFSESEEGRAMW